MALAQRMGAFLAQACPGTPERIEVGLYGDLREIDSNPIQAAAVCGVMRCAFPETVTLVNARALATEKGIDVVESTSSCEGGVLEPDGHPAQDLRARLLGGGDALRAQPPAPRRRGRRRSRRDPAGAPAAGQERRHARRSRPSGPGPGPAQHQHREDDRRPEAGQRPRGDADRGRQRSAARRAGRGDDRPRRARSARPETGLILVPIGFDLGGTKLLMVADGPRGRVVHRLLTGIAFDGRALSAAVESFLDTHRDAASAVGVAIPGLVGPGPYVQACDVLPGLVGWRPPATLLATRFAMINDAAAALAEECHDDPADVTAAAGMAGTGIGGGACDHGQAFGRAEGWWGGVRTRPP